MGIKNKFFRPKNYLKPSSVTEATRLLATYGEKARLIAGGTDVLVNKEPRIEVLIDITGLNLDYIKTVNRVVKIGAATTFAHIEAAPLLNISPYNILSQAAHQMGTPQIRNMATIGGNICSSVPSADSAPPLLALDANVSISSVTGRKSLGIVNFFLNVRKNALEKGEILREICLPYFPAHTEAIFIKRGRVVAGDLAVVNAAIRITMNDNGICQEARIALGAVAPIPLRVKKAEAMLQGNKPNDELIKEVADQASKEIRPISDIRGSAEYRTFLCRVIVERALKDVVARLSN